MTMASAAERCIDALDAAGLERAVVCGLSMGGYVAFELWRTARERFAGLVLANTRAGRTRRRPRQLVARWPSGSWRRATGSSSRARLRSCRIARRQLRRRVRESIALAAGGVDRAAALGMAERPDSTPDLATIDVPHARRHVGRRHADPGERDVADGGPIPEPSSPRSTEPVTCRTWRRRVRRAARAPPGALPPGLSSAAGAARRLTSVTTPAAFAAQYPFPLDDFQVTAIDAVDAGRSVLVAAPTGSGKTVVAEFAIERALDRGGKAFYTTPLKALSNQKYGDLVARHGADRVGLLTGDNAVNSEAPVVVMTTEVLRNMLYERSGTLDGLMTVIMDEVHYLQDPYRGAVGGGAIHLALSLVVCLSATISNAEEFGEWIQTLRGRRRRDRRAPSVPLEHHYRSVVASIRCTSSKRASCCRTRTWSRSINRSSGSRSTAGWAATRSRRIG
jgi:hypothetical protein